MASIGVVVAVIENQNILLGLHEEPGGWGMPGGPVFPGESPAQAAVRYVQEQTGARVELQKMVGVYSQLNLNGRDVHQVLFTAKPHDNRITPLAGEIIALRYFPFTELPPDLMPWQSQMVSDSMDGLGGALAWLLNRIWPFEPGLNRTDLSARQVSSEMTPAEFYRYFLGQTAPGGDLEEVGASSSALRPDWVAFQDGDLTVSMENDPEVSVNVAIMQDGKILLTRRVDFEVWCLPGGQVEPGESLAEAARREAQEETGLDVRLVRLVGIYSEPRWFYRGLHVVVFAAEVSGGSLCCQPGEVLEQAYFAADELPHATLYGHRQRALDAIRGAGGGRAWVQQLAWPLPLEIGREEILEQRAAAGLDRSQYFLQVFERKILLRETCEAGC